MRRIKSLDSLSSWSGAVSIVLMIVSSNCNAMITSTAFLMICSGNDLNMKIEVKQLSKPSSIEKGHQCETKFLDNHLPSPGHQLT